MTVGKMKSRYRNLRKLNLHTFKLNFTLKIFKFTHCWFNRLWRTNRNTWTINRHLLFFFYINQYLSPNHYCNLPSVTRNNQISKWFQHFVNKHDSFLLFKERCRVQTLVSDSAKLNNIFLYQFRTKECVLIL